MKKKIVSAYALVLQIGLTAITSIMIGLLIGLGLEKLTGIKFTIPFIIIGMLAAVKSSYKLIKSQVDLGNKNDKTIHKDVQTFDDSDSDLWIDDPDYRLDNY